MVPGCHTHVSILASSRESYKHLVQVVCKLGLKLFATKISELSEIYGTRGMGSRAPSLHSTSAGTSCAYTWGGDTFVMWANWCDCPPLVVFSLLFGFGHECCVHVITNAPHLWRIVIVCNININLDWATLGTFWTDPTEFHQEGEITFSCILVQF